MFSMLARIRDHDHREQAGVLFFHTHHTKQSVAIVTHDPYDFPRAARARSHPPITQPIVFCCSGEKVGGGSEPPAAAPFAAALPGVAAVLWAA